MRKRIDRLIDEQRVRPPLLLLLLLRHDPNGNLSLHEHQPYVLEIYKRGHFSGKIEVECNLLLVEADLRHITNIGTNMDHFVQGLKEEGTMNGRAERDGNTNQKDQQMDQNKIDHKERATLMR